MDMPKNRIVLAGGVAAAGLLTAALAAVAWPALMRPEPPLERAGDDGLQIRLVEPPKAMAKLSSPLDVGLSEGAQATAKNRQALFVRTPTVRPPSPAPRPHAPSVQMADADEVEDGSRPLERIDDQWERQTRRDRFAQVQRQRLDEEERMRDAQGDRAAWEREARDRRRWEATRERDAEQDRYPSTADEDRGPRPERW